MTEIILEIKVIPNAGRDELKGNRLYLTAPAVDGKANEALIDFLSDHYNVKKNQIKIMRGHSSRQKVIKIL